MGWRVGRWLACGVAREDVGLDAGRRVEGAGGRPGWLSQTGNSAREGREGVAREGIHGNISVLYSTDISRGNGKGAGTVAMAAGTREKILEVGKREFLAKGFKDASLRHIVKEAGFTQGAFYGYYPDKAALFDALVSPAADGLIEQFKAAQKAHFDLVDEGRADESGSLSTAYLRRFVGYLYDNFDAFKLIICCSGGTRYEHFVHDLVELELEQTARFYEEVAAQGGPENRISPELQHMITSAYFTAVFETVAHDMPRERALSYIEELAAFFTCGWEGLLGARE